MASQTREPVQERGIETRNRIIEAAKKLFSEKGFYRTNTKEIAKEAGVAVGSFYMYFEDKKPLFLEIFRSYYREITEKVLNRDLHLLTVEKDTKILINSLIDMLYRAHTLAPQFHREAMAMIYADEEVRAINDEEEERVISLLVKFIELHRDRVRIKDFEAAARVVHKSAEEVIHAMKIFGPRISEERMLKELKEMIHRYLFE